MKITLRRSGGFAGPLNARTRDLETSELPPARARRIEAFLASVTDAGGSGRGGKARPAADRLRYEVEIESEEGTRRLRFDESAVPPELRREWDEILDSPEP
jgi:hypothetical protein